MTKSETRHKQWEIADSLFSSLQDGTVINGQVSEIIQLCGIRADGNAVGKYLQRAESMQHTPFRIQRTFKRETASHSRIYRITLKMN